MLAILLGIVGGLAALLLAALATAIAAILGPVLGPLLDLYWGISRMATKAKAEGGSARSGTRSATNAEVEEQSAGRGGTAEAHRMAA